MLISPAYAQAVGGAAGSGFEMFLPFILIIVIFYFLLWRPQQKKMKQHKEMLGSLKRGDRIITGGGIIGRVARVEGDSELIVEIAPEVRVRLARGTVAEVMVKGEPAKAERKPQEKIVPEKQIGKKDYYSILGLRKGSTEEKISTAYRKLAKKYHPDVNPNDQQARAKFDEIKEAYETLKDPKKREKYDSQQT